MHISTLLGVLWIWVKTINNYYYLNRKFIFFLLLKQPFPEDKRNGKILSYDITKSDNSTVISKDPNVTEHLLQGNSSVTYNVSESELYIYIGFEALHGGVSIYIWLCGNTMFPQFSNHHRVFFSLSTAKNIIGCVRLASLCPRGAHLGEPLTRANQTITHPLEVNSCTLSQPHVTHSTSRALGDDPGEPLEWRQSYLNLPGADRGRPREANKMHPLFFVLFFHNVLCFCCRCWPV